MTVLGTGQGMEVPSGGRNNVPQKQWYLQEVVLVATCQNDRFLMGEERQKEGEGKTEVALCSGRTIY